MTSTSRPAPGTASRSSGDRPAAAASSTVPTSPTRWSSADPRVPTAGSTRVYRRLAGGLIAGLARLGVDAAIARHDGPAGPVCFAGQQGADLRVGERKLCGSAQVRRNGAVLQHGSILLDRLPFDETDLLTARPGAPIVTRERLRAATVTLAELGAPTDPRVVGEAVVEGFRSTLDLDLQLDRMSRVGSTARGG